MDEIGIVLRNAHSHFEMTARRILAFRKRNNLLSPTFYAEWKANRPLHKPETAPRLPSQEAMQTENQRDKRAHRRLWEEPH
jgi:hypothetical protein